MPSRGKRKPSKKVAAELDWWFRLVVSGVPNCVLYVAGDVVRGTLGLIDLAFRLKLLVTGQLAGGILDGAFTLSAAPFTLSAAPFTCSRSTFHSPFLEMYRKLPKKSAFQFFPNRNARFQCILSMMSWQRSERDLHGFSSRIHTGGTVFS